MYENAKLDLFISKDKNYTKLYEDEYFVIYEVLYKIFGALGNLIFK